MDNVRFFQDELNGKMHAIIDNGDGSITSMPKELYDEQQAAMPKQEWVEPQLTK